MRARRQGAGSQWRCVMRVGIGATMLALPLTSAADAPASGEPSVDRACCAKAPATLGEATESPETELRPVAGIDVPDLQVLDQNGNRVRFYTDLVKDRAVAVNFVFTSCKTICPPMGALFAQLQQRLGDRAGTDIHLLSVSLDPANDSPERLRAWAQSLGATDHGWTLVTGHRRNIEQILRAFQAFTPDFEDHAPILVLGNDKSGEWTRAHGFTPPDRVAEILDDLIDGHHHVQPADESQKKTTASR